VTLGTLWCGLLFGVSAVFAVPVDVSSGFVSIAGQSGLPEYLVVGQDFLHSGTGGDSGNVGAASCFPCKAGDTLSLSSHLAGSTLAGHTTVNGVDHDVPFAPDRSGLFDFTAPALTIPDVDLDLFTFSEPFAFLGALFFPGNQSVSLAGQGIATLQLSGTETNAGRLFSFDSIRYDFVAATPEPGTLVFLGSGAVALALFRDRRRVRA
jgi:PEP-CTERM motif